MEHFTAHAAMQKSANLHGYVICQLARAHNDEFFNFRTLFINRKFFVTSFRHIHGGARARRRQLTWYKWLYCCDSHEASRVRHLSPSRVAFEVLALASTPFAHLSSAFDFRFESVRLNPVCLLPQYLVSVWVDDLLAAVDAGGDVDDDVAAAAAATNAVDSVDCSTWLHCWQLFLWHSNAKTKTLSYAKSMSSIICFALTLLHRSLFSLSH